MKCCSAALVVLSCLFGGVPSVAQELSGKIIGGSFVDLTGGPVALILTSSYICSGVLVGPSEVLTAGHCTATAAPANDYSVVVGGGTYGVSSVHFNSSYDVSGDVVENAPYDTGMLLLSSPVTGATPIPVLRSLPVEVGDPATIYGYGTNENSGLPDRDPTENGKRANIYVEDVSGGLLSSSHLFGLVNASTCAGDSGGPMVQAIAGHSAVVGSLSIGTNGISSSTCFLSDGGYYSYVNLQSETSRSFLGQFAGVRVITGPRIFVESAAKQAKRDLTSALRVTRLTAFKTRVRAVIGTARGAVGYADGGRRSLLNAALTRLTAAKGASSLTTGKQAGRQALLKLNALVKLGVD